jgi:hypothetical protein
MEAPHEMTTSTDTTILLDVYERLGSIEAKLASTLKSHEALEKDVAVLKGLHQKFGGVVLTLTVLWALICAGFAYYSDSLKGLFHK